MLFPTMKSHSSLTAWAVAVLSSVLPAQQPTAWYQVSANAAPGYNASSVRLAFDQQRGVLVLVMLSSSAFVWEWDGKTWTRINPTPYPNLSESFDFVYDSARKVCVGLFTYGNTLDTWEWNGTVWTKRTTSSPPYRRWFGMAYDSLRSRTVMFGGSDNSNTAMTETWEYDGNVWQQKSAGGPSPRIYPAMTYDPIRGETVLFGGQRGIGLNVYYADTWTWTGSTWVEHFGVFGPANRAQATFAYDPVRDRCVLFGGTASAGTGDTTTWEWNGSSWKAQTTGSPAKSAIVAMAFDRKQQQLVLYGVFGSSPPEPHHWVRYTFPDPQAKWAAFGSGCAGTAGTPSMAIAPGSLPWAGYPFTVNVTNLPASSLRVPFGLLGASNASWQGLPLPFDLGVIGMPGCLLHVGMDLTFPLSAPTGSTTWSVLLPSTPAFVGSLVYQQIAVLDPGANPLGVSMSNAGQAYVGFK